MTNKHLIIILSFFSLSCFSQTNHYILFDITGSMVGRGKDNHGVANEDIWNKSLGLLKKQLKHFNNGDNVTLFLYGSKFYNKGTHTINDSSETLKNITRKIESIKNEDKFETCTCTYYALNEALKKIEHTKNINRIYLFTDGRPTPDCSKNCNVVTPQKVMQGFDKIIQNKESDYLFIYKLKSEIDLDTIVTNHPKVRMLVNPFSEEVLTVFVTPHNKTIVFNEKVHMSSQKFTFNGTGVDEFLNNTPINISMSNFTLSNNKKSVPQDANLVNPKDSMNKILLTNKPQPIEFLPANNSEVFDKEVYTSHVFYTFSNKSKKRTITSGDKKINVEILSNKSKVIFNNKAEKPKVDIEFID